MGNVIKIKNMGNYKLLEDRWYHICDFGQFWERRCDFKATAEIGIITIQDLLSGEVKSYIGLGSGENQMLDIKNIIACGVPYQDPDHNKTLKELSEARENSYALSLDVMKEAGRNLALVYLLRDCQKLCQTLVDTYGADKIPSISTLLQNIKSTLKQNNGGNND